MSVLGSMIGWLAPPVCISCGFESISLCEACSVAEILPHGSRCWRCGSMTANGKVCGGCAHLRGPVRVFIVTDYEAIAKDLIHVYKYSHQRMAAEPIAKLMSETLLGYVSDEEFVKKNYLLIPVPTATSRVRERGFDHGALLARTVAANTGFEFKSALGRLGQTRQVGAKKQDRLKQLENKFYVKNVSLIKGRNVLLIDDVITTGGTLIAASKVLREYGAKSVNALVFAKKL